MMTMMTTTTKAVMMMVMVMMILMMMMNIKMTMIMKTLKRPVLCLADTYLMAP